MNKLPDAHRTVPNYAETLNIVFAVFAIVYTLQMLSWG